MVSADPLTWERNPRERREGGGTDGGNREEDDGFFWPISWEGERVIWIFAKALTPTSKVLLVASKLKCIEDSGHTHGYVGVRC